MSPVVKKNNVLQLHVDAASEHSIGPKQSRSAGAKETVYLGGVPGEFTHTPLSLHDAKIMFVLLILFQSFVIISYVEY